MTIPILSCDQDQRVRELEAELDSIALQRREHVAEILRLIGLDELHEAVDLDPVQAASVK